MSAPQVLVHTVTPQPPTEVLESNPPPAYEDILGNEPLDIDVKNISEQDKKELLETAESVHSAVSDDTAITTINSSLGFNPSKSLHINARGIAFLRLPLPSRELEIPIYNSDGSIAYLSKRERSCSGNAILASPDHGDLIASFYRFGPGRDPIMKLLKEEDGHNEITVSGKWTSRSQTFTYATAATTFEWHYVKEKHEVVVKETKKIKKFSQLVLEVKSADKKEVKRIAHLVRTDETRTPGSSRFDAGNGGELKIDELVAKGLGIPEEIIVASAILMLKKEIDRRRAVQFAIIAGAAGS